MKINYVLLGGCLLILAGCAMPRDKPGDMPSKGITAEPKFQDYVYPNGYKIKWSGQIVDRVLEGDGIYLTEMEHVDRSFTQQRENGRMIKGVQIGLWCTSIWRLDRWRNVTKKGVPSCSVRYGGSSLTPRYEKQPDGSWRGAAPLPAGALEAFSDKVIAEYLAGRDITALKLVATTSIMEDLVRGARIEIAAPGSFKPGVLNGKRVALVLSSNMLRELDRFKRERQQLIEASLKLDGELRANFIASSDPERMLTNVYKTLQQKSSEHESDRWSIKLADDLAGLQSGQFDYVIVVDWKDETRFDLLGGKYNQMFEWNSSIPEEKMLTHAFARDRFGFYVIDSRLKLVASLEEKRGSPTYRIGRGDGAYLEQLYSHFNYAFSETNFMISIKRLIKSAGGY